MAGIERNAISMALRLHCLCIRVAGSSFLFSDERGVIVRTSPKRICRFLMFATGASTVPTIATSLPVPMMMCFTCQEVVDIRLAKTRVSERESILSSLYSLMSELAAFEKKFYPLFAMAHELGLHSAS